MAKLPLHHSATSRLPPSLLVSPSSLRKAFSLRECIFVSCFLNYIAFERLIPTLVSNHNKIITGLLILLVAGEFSSIMVYSAYLFRITFVTSLATHYALTIQKTMNVLTAVTDTVLAASLVVLLHRGQSAFKSTASVVHRLTQFIIGTSVITVCVAFASLTCTFVWPDSFSFLAFDLLVAKCELPEI